MALELHSHAIGTPPAIQTLGALKAAGYRARSVKQELRENTVRRLSAGETLLPGIVGYEETVEPQIAAAMLSGHDLLLLGLRGQAKTRILRSLVDLLDEWMPILAKVDGVELREDPLRPVTGAGRALVAKHADKTPISWVHRTDRYTEKLATPDVTVADLIGEIDIIKHAEGRYLADEATMHFGLIPRANRGLFAVNELPDLAPRIQVGLFNVLEERDVQIRGYPVRLELDIAMVFSANPEDYTNRGRIVTPLKDRIGSVVRTHYPFGNQAAMKITRENAFVDRSSNGQSGHEAVGEKLTSAKKSDAPAASVKPLSLVAPPASPKVRVPEIIHEIIEQMIASARKSPHINQASGVSVRASISALENVASSAEIRALATGESAVSARPCDLSGALAGCRGKIELLMAEDSVGSDHKPTEDKLLEALMGEALKAVLARLVPLAKVEHVADEFKSGLRLQVGDGVSAKDALATMGHVKGLLDAADLVAKAVGLDKKDDQERACAGELVLEYLYVNNRLSKAGTSYSR